MKTLRNLLLLSACLILFGSLGAKALGQNPRQEQGLNAGWKFHLGEVTGASADDFDDGAWPAVDLPHTWNALDGQDGGGNYLRGTGWYRRHFAAPDGWRERRIYLQFDGVNRRADVYLNGRLLGTHLGGFARFRFDATPLLRHGADNVLAVRVNNEVNGIAPTDADFTFFGGIYRDVSLLVTDPVQVETLDYASPGVYLRQSRVTPRSAELSVTIKLANHRPRPADLRVSTLVAAAGGAKVAETESAVRLDAGKGGAVLQRLLIERPRLWDGLRDPYLYRVRVEVYEGGVLRDRVEQPLGLRFYSVDPGRGFILNGRHLDLHGVNRHQDRPGKGWAIDPADERKDFAIIKEMGANAIRVAHYQQSQLWYELADRGGMVLWAEIPFVGAALDTPEFGANAVEQLRELICQNYNHPSIFFWGVGNETRGAAADPLLARLAAEVRLEDPTRLSTYASDHGDEDPKNWHTDLLAFNKYYGWYRGEFEDFAAWADRMHDKFPRAPVGISEYGAGASVIQHEEPPTKPQTAGRWHPEEYQALYHEAHWNAMRTRPYLWCKFVWNMFDFASDSRNEGDAPGRNDKGLVSYDRKTRKDAFYFYKANWSREPVLYIAGRRHAERTTPSAGVKVYSNAAAVELFVNGVSQGRRPGAGHIFLWPEVSLKAGANRVEARAVSAGLKLSDRCVWTYTPGRP